MSAYVEHSVVRTMPGMEGKSIQEAILYILLFVVKRESEVFRGKTLSGMVPEEYKPVVWYGSLKLPLGKH